VSAFGQQNQVLVPTPRGWIDSDFPAGNDGSDVFPVWDVTGFPNLQTLQVGTAISIDLTQFLSDPGSPSSELGFYDVTGNARAAGWSISGTTLTNNNLLAGSGVFRLVAVRKDVSAVSTPLTFVIKSPLGTDNVSPTIPTGIVAAQGTSVGTIALSFDTPCDIASGNAPASGSSFVDVVVNGVAVAPSPIVVPANSLQAPVGVNLGNISSPASPSYTQNGKAWTLAAAGTGIHGTATEQCLLLDFGTFTGARTLIAKLNSYTAGAATSAFMGLIIHETAVVGGKFIAWGMRPSNGTPSLILETRATTGGVSAQQASLAIDQNGNSITGPVYVKISRAADLKTVTVSYSLDQSAWIDVSTQVVTMNSAIHYGLVMSGQLAGTQATGIVEEVAVSNTPRISAVVSSSTQLPIQLRATDADNNVSDVSVIILGVPKPPAANAFKWFPGHYQRVNSFHFDSAAITQAKSQLSAMASNPNVKGIKINWYPQGIDKGTTNAQYSAGIANLISILDFAQSLGKKVIVEISERVFATANGTIPGNAFPVWWVNNGWVTAGTSGGTQAICQLYNSTFIQSAWIPMFQALGAAIDSHPALAMITVGDETAISTGVPSFNLQAYYTQIKAYAAATRAAFATTPIHIMVDFLNGGDLVYKDLLAYLSTIVAMAVGGPDPPLPGPVTITRDVTINNAFRGVYGGVAGAGIDYRGKMLFHSEVQDVGLSISPSSPSNIWTYQTTTSQLFPHFMSWQFETGASSGNNWSTGILPFINSIAGVTNSTPPNDGATYAQ